jgi:hypothetical protein
LDALHQKVSAWKILIMDLEGGAEELWKMLTLADFCFNMFATGV